MSARLRLYRCEYCGIVRALHESDGPRYCTAYEPPTGIRPDARCGGDLTPITLGDFLVATDAGPPVVIPTPRGWAESEWKYGGIPITSAPARYGRTGRGAWRRGYEFGRWPTDPHPSNRDLRGSRYTLISFWEDGRRAGEAFRLSAETSP